MPKWGFSKNAKCFRRALSRWLTESFENSFRIYRWCIYVQRISNSIIWTLSLERIIKSSILVPILRTDHSQIHESPLFPFFQRIEQLFVRVKNTLEYENVESYRKPYILYMYNRFFSVSFRLFYLKIFKLTRGSNSSIKTRIQRNFDDRKFVKLYRIFCGQCETLPRFNRLCTHLCLTRAITKNTRGWLLSGS